MRSMSAHRACPLESTRSIDRQNRSHLHVSVIRSVCMAAKEPKATHGTPLQLCSPGLSYCLLRMWVEGNDPPADVQLPCEVQHGWSVRTTPPFSCCRRTPQGMQEWPEEDRARLLNTKYLSGPSYNVLSEQLLSDEELDRLRSRLAFFCDTEHSLAGSRA